jgi:hypothetical protein
VRPVHCSRDGATSQVLICAVVRFYRCGSCPGPVFPRTHAWLCRPNFWSCSQIPLARPVRRFCSCLHRSLISAQRFFQPHEPTLIWCPTARLLLSATVRSLILPLLCCHSKHFDFGCHSSISLVPCFGLLQVRTDIVL